MRSLSGEMVAWLLPRSLQNSTGMVISCAAKLRMALQMWFSPPSPEMGRPITILLGFFSWICCWMVCNIFAWGKTPMGRHTVPSGVQARPQNFSPQSRARIGSWLASGGAC